MKKTILIYRIQLYQIRVLPLFFHIIKLTILFIVLILKYLDELSKVNEYSRCPCADAKSVNMPAFRYAISTNTPEDNFIPQSIKDREAGRPRRVFPPDSQQNCEYHGLSMFHTKDKAMRFWTKILTNRIRELLGYDVLFTGTVEENDGLITPIDRSGHFNLYEYVGNNLSIKFTYLEHLP